MLQELKENPPKFLYTGSENEVRAWNYRKKNYPGIAGK
jgi:hypothetical protein